MNKFGLIVSQTCVALITGMELNMSQIFKSGFTEFRPFNGKFHQMQRSILYDWKFHGPVGPVRHVIVLHCVQHSAKTGVNKVNTMQFLICAGLKMHSANIKN